MVAASLETLNARSNPCLRYHAGVVELLQTGGDRRSSWEKLFGRWNSFNKLFLRKG